MILKYIFFIILSSCILSCVSNSGLQTIKSNEKPVRIANDSLEYEVIIFDLGFNRFLNSDAQPRGYNTQSFLEIKNKQFVTTYNIRANNPLRYGKLYPQAINYEFTVNYGYEVNYLLFNYFLFFEQKYQQRL